MAETTEMTIDKNMNPNPVSSLISKLQGLFNMPPPPQRNDVVAEPVAVVSKKENKPPPPPVVRVPREQVEVPSLRLEEEDAYSEQNTNPIVLWQVYAIGGFFVLRWVLARWNERRAKKKPSDEEPSPTDD